MTGSKYDLETTPTTLANGARVLDQIKGHKGRRDWILECQNCLAQWSTQAVKVANREDASMCPACSRRAAATVTEQSLENLSLANEQRRADAHLRRISDAVAFLQLEGYKVTKE